MHIIKRIIVTLIMAFCLPATSYCDTLQKSPGEAGMSTLLNAYSAFADEHFNSILRGLRMLASTSEVKSGKWAVMKGLLAEFRESGITPAAVWYVRPDGKYYTVKKGSIGVKLVDRPYFPGLMSGKEVIGYLVISRSTGERAAVFAVPVKRGDKITGAVGVSVSVDETSRMLDKEMGLPQNFVFYALDTQGRVSLHGKPELLFAYPSDLGSKTLNEAVKKMMSEREGTVTYEFQGNKTVYFKKSPLTGWVYALGVIADAGQGGK